MRSTAKNARERGSWSQRGRVALVTTAAWCAAGCAPSWRVLEERAWPSYGGPAGGVHFAFPDDPARREVIAFDGASGGHPIHVEGVAAQLANLTVVLLAIRYVDTTLPPVDDAGLQAARASLAEPGRDGQRGTVLSFRPATTAGLPGFDAEVQYGSYWGGYVRGFVRVAYSEHTAYVLATYDSSGRRDWYPDSRAIEARLVRSFRADAQRPPTATASGDAAARPTIALPPIAIRAPRAAQPAR